jgi:hypothetical protein
MGDSMVRRLGEDNESHVDEADGRLTYSLPVAAGAAIIDFAFEIRPQDLAVLRAEPYRRAVLDVIAREVLQRTMQPGAERVTKEAFDDLIATVLHSDATRLDRCISRFRLEYGIDVRLYVDRIMNKWRVRV